MWSPVTSSTTAAVERHDRVGGVGGHLGLDAGPDVGSLGPHQRHGLLLHVGAHQGTVGVVVLEERDERRADRDDLLRRDVHELDLCRRHGGDLGRGAEEHVALEHELEFAEGRRLRRLPDQDAIADEAVLCVERRVGLRDDVVLLLVGGEPHDVVGDDAIDDLAVRRLDEAELVDLRVRREAADQADVRTLGRLDRAHAAVVAEVHVADLEAGTLARQAAGAQRGEDAGDGSGPTRG